MKVERFFISDFTRNLLRNIIKHMMKNLNKNFIPIAIIMAGALIAGAFIYMDKKEGSALSSQEAAEKAIAFINQSIEENVTASLLDVTEEAGLYRIHLKVAETEYNSYITKDGKLLFPNAFNLEEQMEQVSQEEPAGEIPFLEDFVQCLTNAGMKFYGSESCGWCEKQKELFGNSFQYVNYIDCVDPGTNQWSEECITEKIEATPTWQLPNGEKSEGFKSLEKLAELSGCSLE